MPFKLKTESCDVKNAGIIALSCGAALLLQFVWSSPQFFWAVLITFFLPYAKFGVTPTKRHLSLIFLGLIATLCISITAALPNKLWLILSWIFIATIILYSLPRYIAHTQLASIFIVIFIVLSHNMPTLTWHDNYERILATLAGTTIAVVINFIFDRGSYHTHVLKPDKSLLLVQRAIRMALSLTFVIFICYHLNIKNSAWVAISLVVIDQNSLGATVKKAGKRILGTFIGLALGILLVEYVFHPYPLTQLATLLLIFILYSVVRYHYTIAISIGTILLCNLFYMLYSTQITLFDFIMSRINDTLLGIIIGIVSCAVIFPQSLFHALRGGILNFWQSTDVFLKTFTYDKNHTEAFNALHNILCTLNQDIKDFRYEPLSLLFRRYHLCLRLTRLMKRLLKTLAYLPDISQKLSKETFESLLLKPIIESVRLFVEVYGKNPNCKNIVPLQDMEHQISTAIHQLKEPPEAKRILITVKLLVRHYEKMTQTPRWRLEFN